MKLNLKIMKTFNLMITAVFLASSLAMVSCSDNPSTVDDDLEGTTTGGLDIGGASAEEGIDTVITDTDTLRTTSGATTN